MYYIAFIVLFVINYTRQLFKWLFRGFFRTFRYAIENTNKQTRALFESMKKTKECVSVDIEPPRFIGEDGLPKKRRRRGHRGGRKHRKHKQTNKGK